VFETAVETLEIETSVVFSLKEFCGEKRNEKGGSWSRWRHRKREKKMK
jgi:hypothetical protein